MWRSGGEDERAVSFFMDSILRRQVQIQTERAETPASFQDSESRDERRNQAQEPAFSFRAMLNLNDLELKLASLIIYLKCINFESSFINFLHSENHASSCSAIRHDNQSNGLRERCELLDFRNFNSKISRNPDQTL